MFKINDNYLKLPGSYLFSTIAKKVAPLILYYYNVKEPLLGGRFFNTGLLL